MRQLKRSYPKDLSMAFHIPLEKAKTVTHSDFLKLLPLGKDTAANHFFTVFNNEVRDGHLWLTKYDSSLYISNIYIMAKHRSQGIGGKAIKWIKRKALRLGCNSVGLNVFSHNPKAMAFYGRSGFQVSHATMNCRLGTK